jgi:tetratricopeptide (TPR) repeat protein
MRRTLNVRLFACLLVAVLVLGIGVHFLHAFQVQRSASGLFEQATQAENEGKYDRAADLLESYLSFVPKDVDALERFGLALDKKKSDRDRFRALQVMQQVLRLDESRTDVRRRLIDTAIYLKRFGDAAGHAQKLLKLGPKDDKQRAELEELQAWCHEADLKLRDATIVCLDAIGHDPARVSSYVMLARLQRRMENPDEATNVMNKLVAKNWSSVPAHLAWALYFKELGKPADLQAAEKDLEYVCKMLGGSEDADVLMASALVQMALARKRNPKDQSATLDKARDYLEQGISALTWQKGVTTVALADEIALLTRQEVAMYGALAEIEIQDGRTNRAIDVLRRGIRELPDNTEKLQWQLTDLLAQNPDPKAADEAQENIDQLDKRGAAQPLVDYLKARMLIAQEKWHEAAQMLETLRPLLEKLAKSDAGRIVLGQMIKQTDMMLGRCYSQLGDADQRYGAYKRLLSQDPDSLPAALGMADALLAMGKSDEALKAYRGVKRDDNAQGVFVRLLLQRGVTLSIPREQRAAALKEVDEILRSAAESAKANGQPVPVIVTLLKAQREAAQGQLSPSEDRARCFSRAEEILKDARKESPKQAAYWTSLAMLYMDQKDKLKEVIPLLDEAEGVVGDRIELRLARVMYWAFQGGPEAQKWLGRLAESAERLAKNDQERLLHLARVFYWTFQGGTESEQTLEHLRKLAERLANNDLARLWQAIGDGYEQLKEPALALEAWQKVTKLQPTSITPRLREFDLAQEAGNVDKMKSAIKKIEAVEGRKGVLGGYAEISLHILEAQLILKADPKNRASDEWQRHLADAREQLSSLAKRRPGWSRLALAEGRIEALAENKGRAIEAYQRALNLGERNPEVIKQLVRWLMDSGRFLEAEAVVHRMEAPEIGAADLQWLAAEASLKSHNLKEAVKWAKEAVVRGTKDNREDVWREYIWLGQVLWASIAASEDQRSNKEAVKEAEDAFRTAVELCSKSPDTWVNLVLHLARTGKVKEAEEEIERAEASLAKSKIPDAQLHLVLGQCYQAIKQLDKSRREYDAAQAANDKQLEPSVMRAAATLYLEMQQPDEAEQLLRKLRTLENRKDAEWAAKWAREVLAGLLAASGDPARADEALELVGLDRTLNPINKGAVDRPEDLRLRAVVLILQKGRRPRLRPTQLRAAQLKAARLLEELSSFQPLSADDQFLIAQIYQSHGDWQKERAVRLALLASHPMNASFTCTCALRLLQHKEIREAKLCLEGLDKADPHGLPTLEVKLRLLLAQGQKEQAIGMLKTYNVTLPENQLIFAKYLALCGLVDESLTSCEQAVAICPAEKVSATALAILYEAKATPEQCRRVKPLIDQMSKKNPRSAVFLDHLAALSNLEGDYKGAISYYSRVLELRKDNAHAMNNLAWLLALKEGVENKQMALELINQAINIMGPEPSLLDTRGVTYLSLGKPHLALDDLLEATAEVPSASKYYHLARALELRDPVAARDALNKAKEAGLKPESLHPLEQATYDDVVSRITSKDQTTLRSSSSQRSP